MGPRSPHGETRPCRSQRAPVTTTWRAIIARVPVAALDGGTGNAAGMIAGSFRCDISRRADIERMAASAVEALGGLDVLVNNAGSAGPTAPVEEADQWEAVMNVDVIGTFHVPRLAIPT